MKIYSDVQMVRSQRDFADSEGGANEWFDLIEKATVIGYAGEGIEAYCNIGMLRPELGFTDSEGSADEQLGLVGASEAAQRLCKIVEA